MSEKRPITKMRERAGLTQIELAQLIGVSENTIANWEKGGATKWIRQLRSLCKVLDCNLRDLDSSPQGQELILEDLTISTIRTVKRYCDAVLNNDKKIASQISSFATVHDNSLRYWLKESDKIMDQFGQGSTNCIDSEIVVNTLKLENLNMQLNQSLPNKVNLKYLSDLLQKIELSHEFLNRYISFDKNNFSRKLIIQTRYLSIYAIGWEPTQFSQMHHHGNSLDAICVIEGEMTHWLLSPEDCEKDKVPFEGCKLGEKYLGGNSEYLSEGKWIFIDRRYAHQIENSSNKRLFTLHVRFGAPPDDDKWAGNQEKPVIIWNQMEQYQVMPS
jgi:transcriptional regulator with XRE-family HTH domain/mannose-6-phosphate isomerase-like protein (cupin superfamily)